ncbi:hypothetical protein GCM10027072_35460 [Streptomyces bullii]
MRPADEPHGRTTPASYATIAACTRSRAPSRSRTALTYAFSALHQVQPGGDPRVGQADADQAQHLALARGQLRHAVRARASWVRRPPPKRSTTHRARFGDRKQAPPATARTPTSSPGAVAGREQEAGGATVQRAGHVGRGTAA